MNADRDYPRSVPRQEPPNGDLEGRVRAVELDVREIKTTLDHVATKTDIESVKSTIIDREAKQQQWLLGILATGVVAIVAALIRTFLG